MPVAIPIIAVAVGAVAERVATRRLQSREFIGIESARGITHEVVTDDGVGLHVVEEVGDVPAGAPTVIFTHGYGLSLDSWPGQREALIGLLYVAGASVALLGARQDPHGRERLAELLAADVLWARGPQVAVLAGCAAVVALLASRLSRDLIFYPVFAVVASLTVPVLGLFLVFAALIAPALWQRAGLSPAAARAGGVAACAAGVAASWAFDAPSGACVALALAAYGAASAWCPDRPPAAL